MMFTTNTFFPVVGIDFHTCEIFLALEPHEDFLSPWVFIIICCNKLANNAHTNI